MVQTAGGLAIERGATAQITLRAIDDGGMCQALADGETIQLLDGATLVAHCHVLDWSIGQASATDSTPAT